MKLYEQKETTPLAFYKFFNYVFLPVGAVSALYSLLAFIFFRRISAYYASWYISILMVQSILMLILYGFMFFSMLKWKKYTLKLFVVLLALCCVSSAFSIIYSATSSIPITNFSSIPNYQMPAEFTVVIENFIKVYTIIVSVVNVGLYTLMFLYFYKRRLLFDGVPYKIPPKYAQTYPPQPYYPPQQPYPPQYYQQPMQCCTNCGTWRPSAEYHFCPECGKQYDG